jgi:hypothetical protein
MVRARTIPAIRRSIASLSYVRCDLQRLRPNCSTGTSLSIESGLVQRGCDADTRHAAISRLTPRRHSRALARGP